ncbi:hypothetical protein [Saccharothrix sp. ST-888]|uniref:hypothetical protein n=1 Tax=Saccharothrix sp. ST-888 TaxID=1427391 RepID=UPI000A7B5D4E|nr:hypothetical protein [Saccharothrix sp. ST-888]
MKISVSARRARSGAKTEIFISPVGDDRDAQRTESVEHGLLLGERTGVPGGRATPARRGATCAGIGPGTVP